MTPVDAIAVNLWTLAIVSVWRVALMTRVIHVAYGFGAAFRQVPRHARPHGEKPGVGFKKK